jgi:hypothetical protein
MCGCILIQGKITTFAWERSSVGGNYEIIVIAEFYEVSVRLFLYLTAKSPTPERLTE